MLRKFVPLVIVALAAAGCGSSGDTIGVTDQPALAAADPGDTDASEPPSNSESRDSDPMLAPANDTPDEPTAESDVGDPTTDGVGATEPEQPASEADGGIAARRAEFVEGLAQLRAERVAEWGHIPIGDIESSLEGEVFPQVLASGRYETSVLGTWLAFELADDAILAREFPGMMSFIEVGLAGTLHIARPTGVFTADGAVDADRFVDYSQKTTPMPDDFDAWIREIPQLEVGEAVDATVAGQVATRYELTPVEDDFVFCPRGTCLNMFTAGPDNIQLFGNQRAVLWHLEHPDDDIVIVAKATNDAYDSWLAFTEALIATIELGTAEDSPISRDQYWQGWGFVAPGVWTLPGVPWTLEIDFESIANHRDGYLTVSPKVAQGQPQSGISLLRLLQLRDGTVVRPEAFGELLRDVYSDDLVTELEPESIFGHDAFVFDVGPSGRDLEFKHTADAPGIGVLGTNNYAFIPVTLRTRMWVFDHEGVTWVAAAGGQNEEVTATALELADEVFGSAQVRAMEVPQAAPAPLTEQFVPLAAGAYTSTVLGVPVVLDVADDWFVQWNREGLLVLSTPDSQGPGDHGAVFVRPTSFTQTTAGVGLEAWLGSAPESLEVSQITPIVVGGRDAWFADVRIGDDPQCERSEGACALLLSSNEHMEWLAVGVAYRLVWFDDDTPFVIVIGTPADDEAWLEIATALVEALEFGPDA